MTRDELFQYAQDYHNVRPEYLWARTPGYAILRHAQNRKWYAAVIDISRARLGLPGEEIIDILNVKCDPALAASLNTQPGFLPAYHMNKEHWNTIILDDSIPDQEVQRMIDESYRLVTDSPTKRIYEAVKQIPYGHVATYGQVAELAGNPKMSRAVGNALHKNPDPENIHCYRVVNSKGELAGRFAFGGADVQAELLRSEGIEVVDNCVDLEKYGI